MLIGILSDTHDNLAAIQLVRDFFLRHEVKYMFHCGDLTDPDLIPYLDGCQVIYVSGNMDTSIKKIGRALRTLNPHNWAGASYSGAILDYQIASVHGNVEGQVEAMIQSQKYDYLFHGHTHERRDEVYGKTRVINPGALGGKNSSPGSFCMLDLDTNKATFFSVSKTYVVEIPIK